MRRKRVTDAGHREFHRRKDCGGCQPRKEENASSGVSEGIQPQRQSVNVDGVGGVADVPREPQAGH